MSVFVSDIGVVAVERQIEKRQPLRQVVMITEEPSSKFVQVLMLRMVTCQVSAPDPVYLRFRPGKVTKQVEKFDKAVLHS
jgi:hypothetical protein